MRDRVVVGRHSGLLHELGRVIALQGDYTAKLVKQAGVATNYHAITHPSVPNYLAITSGQTWGVDAGIYRALPPEDIGHQLTAANIRWRAYMEGLDAGQCL